MKNKLQTIALLVLCLLISTMSVSQFSIIQDGSNETSYQILEGNVIGINVESESIGFSFSPKTYSNDNKPLWKINSSINTKKGIAKIFSKGKFQFSGQLGANLIFDKTDYNSLKTHYTYNYIGLNILYSRNNTFDSSQIFDEQFSTKSNLGIRLDYGWNFENAHFESLGFLGEFTSGIALSVGIKDNSDLLDQVEVVTEIDNIITNSEKRSISTRESAFLNDQLKTNQLFSRVNFDFGKHIFAQRVLINFHLTYAIDEKMSSVFNPAFGFFLMKKGAPLNAKVGLQLQYNDWFNNRDSNNSRWERSALVLTAGFPIQLEKDKSDSDKKKRQRFST